MADNFEGSGAVCFDNIMFLRRTTRGQISIIWYKDDTDIEESS